jgi:hypothetical protein
VPGKVIAAAKLRYAEQMLVWQWVGIAAMLGAGALESCSSGGTAGTGSPTGTPTDAPTAAPTTPAMGTVDGFPFTVVAAYAFWAKNGPPYLWIELSSYQDDCRQAAFAPDKGTVIGLQIPQSMLAVGRYPATDSSFVVDKTGVAMSAAAYPYNDAGLPTSWGTDLQGHGVAWITGVTDMQIAGAFWASDAQRNISASGTFTAPICGAGDAGVGDAASD